MVEYIDNALTSNHSLITLDQGDSLIMNFALIDITGRKVIPESATFTAGPITLTLTDSHFKLEPVHTKYLLPGTYPYRVVVETDNLRETVCRGNLIVRG